HIVLTHLSMHYSTPVTVAQLEEEIGDDATVILAYDGISFNLSG
ncbi:MAG: MBL fold metallo-hydrolase, partial [Clostridia bacterium]|nr:MBL fold metallo-hydrolase [Clostridia bacterium]